jgi:hypothetical protein
MKLRKALKRILKDERLSVNWNAVPHRGTYITMTPHKPGYVHQKFKYYDANWKEPEDKFFGLHQFVFRIHRIKQ